MTETETETGPTTDDCKITVTVKNLPKLVRIYCKKHPEHEVFNGTIVLKNLYSDVFVGLDPKQACPQCRKKIMSNIPDTPDIPDTPEIPEKTDKPFTLSNARYITFSDAVAERLILKPEEPPITLTEIEKYTGLTTEELEYVCARMKKESLAFQTPQGEWYTINTTKPTPTPTPITTQTEEKKPVKKSPVVRKIVGAV